MRKRWFKPSIAINGLLWIVGLALQIGGWVNQYVAIALLCVAFLGTVATVLYWLRKGVRNVDEKKEYVTIIKDAKVRLDAKNADKATGMEVNTPAELNNIDVNVTAENVREATGFRSVQTNKEVGLFSATILCSCGKQFTYSSTGYRPSKVTCPHCGKEHEIH
jgi:hypothetical protein